MGWFSNMIRRKAGTDALETKFNDLSKLHESTLTDLASAKAELAEHKMFHKEDFGGLAKRIHELEEEVFDCSADQTTVFKDEDDEAAEA